jgi:hypothetical protein
MKRRHFPKSAAAAVTVNRVSWGIALAMALSACGGGGGGGDDAAVPELESLAAQAMKKRRLPTEPAPAPTEPAPAPTEPAPAPAPGTNLVSNPGFESGMTGWANWANSVTVAGQAASGSNSLQVGAAAGGVGQNIAGAKAGTSYRFSGKAKVTSAGETVYLGLKFLDAAGAALLEKNTPITATSYGAFSVDAVAPANSTTAMVYAWKNAGAGYAHVDDVALASLDAASAPTPTQPAPAPAPTDGKIATGNWPNTLLQTGFDHDAYWIEDGVWGAGGLTRGTYTGMNGTQYEQSTGVSPNMGPNGEVSFRMTWKWPTGTTEVKSYPSVVSGAKPGWYNSWTTPGGFNVRLLNGTDSTIYPTGATPGTFFPLQLPIASLKSSFSYSHLATPTGRGHLSYDIWLQSSPTQAYGFGAAPITHEIMIPLNNWGDYGKHLVGRNPAWYSHDATIDGRLFHVYVNKDASGVVRPNFGGGWKFVVFQPDAFIPPGTTLDIAKFVNYVATQKDSAGTPWGNGNEHMVSIELGVEPVDGVGDLQINNYRVWK